MHTRTWLGLKSHPFRLSCYARSLRHRRSRPRCNQSLSSPTSKFLKFLSSLHTDYTPSITSQKFQLRHYSIELLLPYCSISRPLAMAPWRVHHLQGRNGNCAKYQKKASRNLWTKLVVHTKIWDRVLEGLGVHCRQTLTLRFVFGHSQYVDSTPEARASRALAWNSASSDANIIMVMWHEHKRMSPFLSCSLFAQGRMQAHGYGTLAMAVADFSSLFCTFCASSKYRW